MKKILILFINIIIFGLLMSLGCSHQEIDNLQIVTQLKTEKVENNDEVMDKDWKMQYKIIRNVKFHILINEYLDNNDKRNPDIAFLVREYLCFDGTVDEEWNQVYPVTNKIALLKSNEIKSVLDAKNQIKELNPNSSALKLMENTIISDTVSHQWNEQEYDDYLEYSKESPKGLTYEILERST